MDEIEWLEPWIPVAEGNSFVDELQRELSSLHPLFGCRVKAIGYRGDQDDVLFELLDKPPQLAVAHLTWKMSEEPDPTWPWTVIYADRADWVKRCMMPDHAEWSAGNQPE